MPEGCGNDQGTPASRAKRPGGAAAGGRTQSCSGALRVLCSVDRRLNELPPLFLARVESLDYRFVPTLDCPRTRPPRTTLPRSLEKHKRAQQQRYQFRVAPRRRQRPSEHRWARWRPSQGPRRRCRDCAASAHSQRGKPATRGGATRPPARSRPRPRHCRAAPRQALAPRRQRYALPTPFNAASRQALVGSRCQGAKLGADEKPMASVAPLSAQQAQHARPCAAAALSGPAPRRPSTVRCLELVITLSQAAKRAQSALRLFCHLAIPPPMLDPPTEAQKKRK